MAQYSENRAFRHETAAAAGYNLFLFQWVTRQIRYLADQWKINRIFLPINEFLRPNNRITMEFVQVVKTGKCGHLSALALPANATTMAEINPGRTLSAAPEIESLS